MVKNVITAAIVRCTHLTRTKVPARDPLLHLRQQWKWQPWWKRQMRSQCAYKDCFHLWDTLQGFQSPLVFTDHTPRSTAAAAKSLQSCPTLCDPIDGSPSGSPVPGILQATTLEWVAISFSNAWKGEAKVWFMVNKVFSYKYHFWFSQKPFLTRSPYLPPVKPVCRSRSNSWNWTWNNRLVQHWARSMSRLYIFTLFV